MKYYNLILLFFICDVWPLQLFINNPVFYYYSYIYERTESQARTGGLSVTVGFIVQMSFKLFFEGLLC